MDRNSQFPIYRFPIPLLLAILASLVKGKERDLHSDAKHAIQGISSTIHLIGSENIPLHGPALITMNHYARQGFFVLWAALAIAAQLSHDQTWLMTAAWTKRNAGWDSLVTKLSRAVFARIADVYGLITTPPLPPIESETNERAISIRRVFREIKTNPNTILCIAPEGRDFPEGVLGVPAPGTGTFIGQLVQRLERIVPVGVWEQDGRLVVHFGENYDKQELLDQEDLNVSKLVMDRIACLLPASSRNNFPE